MQDLAAFLLQVLRRIVEGVLALVILFEEWGWEPLQALMARFGRWPVFRQVEALIVRLPPGPALVLLLVPSLLLLPVKLSALWMIHQGWRLGGLAIIVVAKLGGTALMARLFALTRPALMRLPWFARGYERWTVWKEAVLARVRASPVWRAARAMRERLRLRWRRWSKQGSGS